MRNSSVILHPGFGCLIFDVFGQERMSAFSNDVWHLVNMNMHPSQAKQHATFKVRVEDQSVPVN